MNKKFLLCVCLMIALTLTLGFGHLAYADSSNQTVDQWVGKDGKQTQTSPKKDMTQNNTQTDGTVTDGPSTFWTFVKLIFSLAIILGLIYLLFKVVSKRTRAYKNDGAIKNVGGVSVGANRSVQLIRIGDEILVVGVGDTVNLIKEITDPETVDSLLSQEPEQPDLVQKNVSKMVQWAAGKLKPLTNRPNGVPKTFEQQLKQILSHRTQEVEKRIGKDSEDARN